MHRTAVRTTARSALALRTKEVPVIPLTRLKGGALFVNADLIQTIEEHHDTVITLTDGTRLPVHESAQDVVDAVLRYHASVVALGQRMFADGAPASDRRSEDARSARVLTLRPGRGE
jgi:flagellar protein FlbD